MKVLIDTSIWSLSFRRSRAENSPERRQLTELIREGRAQMLGAVRQELLAGIQHDEQFEMLRAKLRAFPDIELQTEDYEEASRCFNRCRSRSIQGSNTDFLICAVSRRRRYSIFTTDQNFTTFTNAIELALFGAQDG